MEASLTQDLKDLGYEGSLLDPTKFSQAMEKGAKSTDFTGLVAWFADQFVIFGNVEERVHPTTSPEDSSTFLLELSSFLKELGCINSQLVSGNINQRLASVDERIMLLEYLIMELMACKIIAVKKPNPSDKLQVTVHESDTARSLKNLLVTLQFDKPPENISTDTLFTKIEDKLKTIVQSAPKELLGKPLIMGELSQDQWKNLDELQKDIDLDHKIRREMLLKRLDVTIHSFLWSDRIKAKEDRLKACYQSQREEMSNEPEVTIAQLLAARDDLAIIEKRSSATRKKNTLSNVKSVIIGNVPDRGGRPNEQAPPPPEMPSWQKDRAPDGPRGGRGGGRGGGGGGRGSYRGHKDASSNFGQNRDWSDNQQTPQNQYNQESREGEYRRGGSGGGGHHRGRGGRVQGGWSQGSHNRGGNRSQY